MQLLPSAREDWIALILLPFKVCIVVAIPLLLLLVQIYGHSSPAEASALISCFALSSPILLLGSMIQFGVCKGRRAPLITLAFGTVPILFLIPFLLHELFSR